MAEFPEVYKVLISSPGDVNTERTEVEEAIKDLNENVFVNLGIRLEPIRWENNCYPSVGTDSQAVVNEQLGDDYSIFIGIFWKKHGTTTPRASSGTVDEFERAYARWHETRSPQIMFYFRTGPVLLHELDSTQLGLVNDFRERLRELGILFWDYHDEEHFAKLIRMQLPLAIMQLPGFASRMQSNQGRESVPATVNSVTTPTTKLCIDKNNEDAEEGFLDLIMAGDETFNDLTEIVNRINESIKALGGKVEARTKEIGNRSNDRMYMKQFGNRISEDLLNFTDRLELDTPQFAKLFSRGIDKYTRASTISIDFMGTNEQDLIGAAKTATALRASLRTAKEPMNHLRDVIANTPRLTTSLAQAKKHAVTALDIFISEMTTAIELTLEMEKVIEETIKNLRVKKSMN
jgi:hypothetical protein